MTKMKNTKKGMAKKALSISLVAAMLATSNVPVWAAFEADDTTPIIVEAPAEDDTVAADAFVEEPQTEVVEQSGVEAQGDLVETPGYTTNLHLVAAGNGWMDGVKVDNQSISIKDAKGNEVTDFTDVKMQWRIGGKLYSTPVPYTAANLNQYGVLDLTEINNSNDAKRMATEAVELCIFKENNGTMEFFVSSNAIIPGQVDVSTWKYSLEFDGSAYEQADGSWGVTYNGKEQKLVPSNERYTIEGNR